MDVRVKKVSCWDAYSRNECIDFCTMRLDRGRRDGLGFKCSSREMISTVLSNLIGSHRSCWRSSMLPRIPGYLEYLELFDKWLT